MKSNYCLAYLYCLLSVTFSDIGFAQSLRKELRLAHNHYYFGENDLAMQAYKKILAKYPNVAEVNFLYARSILESSSNEKAMALGYFIRAKDLDPNVDKEILYYLGIAYQYNHQWDKAENCFKQYREGKKEKSEEYKKATKKIDECQNARIIASQPPAYKITNLGEKINTKYADYVPVVSSDQNIIFFTSRREGNVGGPRGEDQIPAEDVFVAVKNGSEWERAKNVVIPKINTQLNESVVSLSHDGHTIYFYKNKGRWGNLYEAELTGTMWGELKPIPNVNTRKHEASIAISPDRNFIIFSSQRKGGKGGLDLYYCKRVKDGWSKPIPCGDMINTPYDDDAPFIDYDGKTVYFSSRGHSSIGGYDIFKTTFDTATGTFTAPVNLGMPINSVGDDIYIYFNPDRKTGYFTSERDGGFGEKDIYYFEPIEPEKPLLASNEQPFDKDAWADSLDIPIHRIRLREDKPNAKIFGVVIDASTGARIPNAILYLNMNTSTTSNLNGEYEFSELPEGKYTILATADDYQKKQVVDVIVTPLQEVCVNILLEKGTGMSTRTLVEANQEAQGASKENLPKSLITNPLRKTLDSIIVVMKRRPEAKAYIRGLGNKAFSDKEAKAIAQYLKNGGISSDRIYAQGDNIRKDENPYTQVDIWVRKGDEGLADFLKTKEDQKRKEFENYLDKIKIRFYFAQLTVSSNLKTAGDSLVNLLNAYPNMKIYINGHTDDIGPEDENMKLSEKRATVIYNYLIQRGIDKNRLTIRAFGETMPIAPNSTPQGRAYNRRVDFTVNTD
ncbi:MAG: OmpA family protein [Bacteroidia bacterium]|nr:OmpA family protein [Bacteroidia bacterium]MDW8302335.1 OmpA family protein [Bacteroidia bacterium]